MPGTSIPKFTKFLLRWPIAGFDVCTTTVSFTGDMVTHVAIGANLQRAMKTGRTAITKMEGRMQHEMRRFIQTWQCFD
jgi:hypothetical protein